MLNKFLIICHVIIPELKQRQAYLEKAVNCSKDLDLIKYLHLTNAPGFRCRQPELPEPQSAVPEPQPQQQWSRVTTNVSFSFIDRASIEF